MTGTRHAGRPNAYSVVRGAGVTNYRCVAAKAAVLSRTGWDLRGPRERDECLGDDFDFLAGSPWGAIWTHTSSSRVIACAETQKKFRLVSRIEIVLSSQRCAAAWPHTQRSSAPASQPPVRLATEALHWNTAGI